MASQCTFESKFLCVDGGSWEDFEFRQPVEQRCDSDGLILHVQKE